MGLAQMALLPLLTLTVYTILCFCQHKAFGYVQVSLRHHCEDTLLNVPQLQLQSDQASADAHARLYGFALRDCIEQATLWSNGYVRPMSCSSD